ncbi:MAG TPA: hypothetical protein VM821_03990, partial [Abditibacteriaceae bacterium]|nr:hypothetical protein [Abditibacteriaceae bacterium]
IMSFYIEPDPVIEEYKKHVGRTLLRENLKLTPQQRLEKLQARHDLVLELKQARKTKVVADAP